MICGRVVHLLRTMWVQVDAEDLQAQIKETASFGTHLLTQATGILMTR